MKGVSEKMTDEIQKSTQQISEKKQDIKYDTRDYVIEFLKQKYEEGNFYIPLEYQRQFIWSEKDKCFFIESILMGLPIPFMFFADTQDGRIEIVDGAQRIQTIVQFVENDLLLQDLTVLKESNGFSFESFDPVIQRRFLNTSIRVVFLEEGTTEQVRQEIFKRINTGGVHASPTETRRGSTDGKFKDLLEACVKNELFNQLAPRTKQTEKRYEGFELVSRFFAYTDGYINSYQNYTGSVTNYIDDYVMEQNRLANEEESLIERYETKFLQMLEYAQNILGERGFRKTLTSKSTPRARFEALSVGISLALEECPTLQKKEITNWIESEEFAYHTKSDAANNKSRLIGRIKYVKDKLLEENQ